MPLYLAASPSGAMWSYMVEHSFSSILENCVMIFIVAGSLQVGATQAAMPSEFNFYYNNVAAAETN